MQTRRDTVAASAFTGVRRRHGPEWAVLAAVAAGGVVGALARYGVAEALPHRPGAVPWATVVVNVAGCLLIGVLMVLVVDVWAAHRLLRPFLGTGLLGGFTTFSTYAVDTRLLVGAGRPAVAATYVVGTLAGALAAVSAGVVAARRLTRARSTARADGERRPR